MSDMIIPEDRERAAKNISDILNGKPSVGNFYTGLRKDGTIFPIQIFTNVISNNGLIKGFRGVILDVSDRVAVERELKDSNE